jgi:large subunit ribosomal protein L35e
MGKPPPGFHPNQSSSWSDTRFVVWRWLAARIKVHELRGKSKMDLQAQLKELKSELSLLRVAQQALQDVRTCNLYFLLLFSAPELDWIDSNCIRPFFSKLVRTSIARVLTVILQKQKSALREAYKKKNLLPLDLRPKKTRAIRRRLTKHQDTPTTTITIYV